MPTRLIDLHVDWLLQYAPDSSCFDPAYYPGVKARQSQASGYLQTTRAAVLSCYRADFEWAARPEPWLALVELIARLEAEFSGRLLIGPDDFDRWEDDKNGMTWGVIGVEGFDTLIRSPDDLPRLKILFDRGVRLFQPVYGAGNLLGGSSVAGDDRGLTELGREFLGILFAAVPKGGGPRPLLDLAHFNPQTSSDVLGWFEADPARSARLLPIYSHGAPAHEGYQSPRALPFDHLRRLRALGGFVGVSVSPPFFRSPDEVQAAIESVAEVPFQGRAGFEGIGIGTDFLGVDQTLLKLGDAGEVVTWALSRFDKPSANALLHDNARKLLARVSGASNLI